MHMLPRRSVMTSAQASFNFEDLTCLRAMIGARAICLHSNVPEEQFGQQVDQQTQV
jgi:hypothetical protein